MQSINWQETDSRNSGLFLDASQISQALRALNLDLPGSSPTFLKDLQKIMEFVHFFLLKRSAFPIESSVEHTELLEYLKKYETATEVLADTYSLDVVLQPGVP